MTNIYDFIVIGAGISACTFASYLNKKFSDLSILLVEHEMRIVGRARTRKSRINQILEYHHGLPSINFSQSILEDILEIVSPLINSRKLLDISNHILLMNKFGVLSNAFTNDIVYRSYILCLTFVRK